MSPYNFKPLSALVGIQMLLKLCGQALYFDHKKNVTWCNDHNTSIRRIGQEAAKGPSSRAAPCRPRHHKLEAGQKDDSLHVALQAMADWRKQNLVIASTYMIWWNRTCI